MLALNLPRITPPAPQRLRPYSPQSSQSQVLLNLVRSSQPRSEAFNKRLLRCQWRLPRPISRVYRQGIREGQILLKILVAVQHDRIEKGRLVRTVAALRHWAQGIQPHQMPSDQGVHQAILSLAGEVETVGGVSQYLEAYLPLVPGLLNYEVTLEPDHKIRLEMLWQTIKKWRVLSLTRGIILV